MKKTRYLTGSVLGSAMLVAVVTPSGAIAQSSATAPAAAPSTPQGQTDEPAAGDEIVVTGSLLRRANTETASPVTVLTNDDLDKRGINTVQDALQTLSANNGGTLMNSFTANGAFAGGASAASLRGLTTSSTLVLFDGLRAAYYPLADDGSRNFVDLNTIPDAIVDRLEVLKDGASSTYGADAVAGVINIITKKQIQGFSARVEAGITQRGDDGNRRVEATYGFGKLEDQGFNAYVSAHYIHSDPLYNRDRGFPYNTSDLSSRCLPGGTTLQCENNGIFNGIQADGTFLGISSGTQINYVRPANGATGVPIAGSRYQQLTNPAAGCGSLGTIVLTGAQLTNTGGNAGATAPANGVLCTEDPVARYSQISPENERLGVSGRLTVKLGDTAEFYAMANFEQSRTNTTGGKAIYRTTSVPGPLLQRYTTASTPGTQGAGGLFGALITLPVWICPRGTTVACTAQNGTLNPNNPFAAQGLRAAVIGRLPDIDVSNEFLTRSYRGAIGIKGSFGGDKWSYAIEATGMRVDLRTNQRGRVFIQNFLDAVNDGSYNWVRPDLNTQAVRDFISPDNINKSYSELYQVQGSLSGSLLSLPGGRLQAAVGASFRDELVNAPSANPGVLNQPTQQYFGINGFSSKGRRNVASAYFEINAPVLNELELSAAGRYDRYSTGESNFSPKFGAKFQPIRQVALRGTFSRGFRIASFAETGSSPTTGFVSANAGPTCLAQNPIANTLYCNGYALGLSQKGAPGLKPEKSRNLTVGAIVEPVPWLTLTADYYNIEKTDVITGANFAPALAAYYAGQPIPAGFQVIPDVPSLPDIAANPNAQPRAAFVVYSYINGPRQNTSGIDFTATANIKLGGGIKLISSLDATYVINYDQTFPGGVKQRYAGTLGNFQITSGSGTPQWRGSWQNTIDFGKASISATAYYTQGYSATAEDQAGAGTAFNCASGFAAAYRDGTPVQCDVAHFINVDMSATYRINDNFTFYLNVLNVFDAKAPLDATTYGGYQYNPAWANAGIIGRSFRAGAKISF
ncbi:MAG: TonB-dependent receptor [Sphingomonas sp.]|jgi:iron complex outermembrane receptor protein|uniref:TonB-dependent receptor domain-containing protein n=1 Tax=Sphingomonas sp. TaxID=28214 RepID=UPI003565C15C